MKLLAPQTGKLVYELHFSMEFLGNRFLEGIRGLGYNFVTIGEIEKRVFDKRKEEDKAFLYNDLNNRPKPDAGTFYQIFMSSKDDASREFWASPEGIQFAKDLADQRTAYFENCSKKFNYGEFTDPRDGEVYHYVKVGRLIWMVENLRYKTEGGFADDGKGSFAYDNDESSAKQYGRLYTWSAAMNIPSKYNELELTMAIDEATRTINYQGIAPEGWHIPTEVELLYLIDYASEHADSILQDALRMQDYWRKNDKGSNDFGFYALPSGYLADGDFNDLGRCTYLRCTDPKSCLYIGREDAYIQDCDRKVYFSVRCVKNLAPEDMNWLAEQSQKLAEIKAAKQRALEEEERKAREIAEHEKRMEMMDAQIEESKNNMRLAQEAEDRRMAQDMSDRWHCKYCGGPATWMSCKASPTGKHVAKKSFF